MTGAELGIDFDWEVIDLLSFENKNPDFIQVCMAVNVLFKF